jgi:polyisoprenoid-binding protein YceI
VLLLCLTSGLAALARQPHRAVAPDSKVAFSISHLTNRAHGKFQKFDGTLSFVKDKPEACHVQFRVDTASIDTGNSGRDENLRGKEYFSVAEFPSMTFESKAFKKVGNNKYMVTGPITIKGRSKNISVPVTLTKTGTTWATGEDVLRFTGNFEVDRTEFGVGEASSLLGSEVAITLDVEFRAPK